MGNLLKSGQICLSISGTTVAEVLGKGRGHDADLIEIRLDLLETPEVQPFFDGFDLPLLFTNRPEWEGGEWRGSEEERLGLLVQAVLAGAAYVDIELSAPKESFTQIMQTASDTTCKSIVSWHNFDETPGQSKLIAVLQQMAESGADIGKIVTTAHDYTDTLRVLSLQIMAQELDFPLACFAMGEAGQVSRAATLNLGGVLTYGAADAQSCTAPGQLTVAKLREVQEILR
jgi:3-dehydroquinate dehydratase-1/3-dehydroquinate dehydratase/shikimate dehydrogenase